MKGTVPNRGRLMRFLTKETALYKRTRCQFSHVSTSQCQPSSSGSFTQLSVDRSPLGIPSVSSWLLVPLTLIPLQKDLVPDVDSAFCPVGTRALGRRESVHIMTVHNPSSRQMGLATHSPRPTWFLCQEKQGKLRGRQI